jgi:hypothetical protein
MGAFNDLLNAVEDRPFYFGIGGIGDYLLLISTFYEELGENDKVDVVFVANNVSQISKFSKFFPKVNFHWFFPIKSFFFSNDLWGNIKSKNCLGTGATPWGSTT